ncbi:MAG: oligosaccharide flippase family protein [Gemmatimonadaceae bacterium]|nr:oligosaccharide flippase family protein [Chitinophagaceae bacterium]
MLKNLIGKLNNKHFLSLAGNGVMSVLGLVGYAILSKFLPSAAELGKWIFFQSTLTLLDTFRSGFLTTALIKFYAGTTKERSTEVVGSVWYLGILTTAGFLILNLLAFLFLHGSKDMEVVLFLQWFGITFIFTLPIFIAGCVLQAESRFDRLLYMRLLNQVSFIVFIIVLIFMNRLTLQSVFYSNFISSVVTSAFIFYKGWARQNTLFKRSKNCVLEIYHYGKYVVGTAISANLLRYSDTFIIKMMLGDVAVAIYNQGLKLIEVVEIPLRSMLATAMPTMAGFYNQGKKVDMLYTMKKYAGMLTLMLIPVAIGAFLMADFVMPILGRKDIAHEAANVWRLFMTFAILFPLERYFAVTLDVIHQPKVNTVKVTIMLIVNIISDFVGIALFGNIYGVAILTVFPTLVGMFIGYYYLNKSMPFNFWSVFSVGYYELKLLAATQLAKIKPQRVN